MKLIAPILLSLTTCLLCSPSWGSHISPVSISQQLPKSLSNSSAGVSQKISSNKNTLNEDSFNRELQWRILNILAQQLFQRNDDQLKNDIFSYNRLYATHTFSVNISSMDPEFYLVKIIDSELDQETQLEIPRLVNSSSK